MMNIQGVLLITFGEVDKLKYLPETEQATSLWQELGSIALPYGSFHSKLDGVRSVRVLPAGKKDHFRWVVYVKYSHIQRGQDDTRHGYFQALALRVETLPLIDLIGTDPNWINAIFSQAIQLCGDDLDVTWLKMEILRMPSINVSTAGRRLPAETLRYLERGGVGLKAPFQTMQDWLYMEELIRQLVIVVYNKKRQLISFSTLSVSVGDRVSAFALPDLAYVHPYDAARPPIEVVESSLAFDQGTMIGLQWLHRMSYAAIILLIVLCLLVGGSAVYVATRPTATPTSTLTPTPTATFTNTSPPTHTPTGQLSIPSVSVTAGFSPSPVVTTSTPQPVLGTATMSGP